MTIVQVYSFSFETEDTTLYKWLYDEIIFLFSKEIKLSNDIFLTGQ